MLKDKRFKCVTISDVRDEIFQKQKFKTKYPWLEECRKNIVAIGASALSTDEFKRFFSTISLLVESGTINKNTGKFFDLSWVDKRIIACALSHNYDISTTDTDMHEFVKQQFEKEYTPPLRVINDWLRNKLIIWNDDMDQILKEWYDLNEPQQLQEDIDEFEGLTGRKYLGP